MSELLLGCGSSREKKIHTEGDFSWKDLTTLDINPDHNPDVVADATNPPLPFEDNTFDEIHAYEVLEHLGQQGDYKLFFAQFTDYHRILKPGGEFYATVPDLSSPWLWGDPSHTRVITLGTLTFLDQDSYKKQVGITAMSDYRDIYKVSFKLVYNTVQDESLCFVLKAL